MKELVRYVKVAVGILVVLAAGSRASAEDEGAEPEAGRAGSVIVGFEKPILDDEDRPTGNVDVHAELLSPAGAKTWGSKSRGAPVASSRLPERRPAICTDGEGGAILAFEREITVGESQGHVSIVAQRIGPDGKRMWLEDGQAPVIASLVGGSRFPAVLSDGAGGAFVAYVWTKDEEIGGVLVHRIGADGKLAWDVKRGGYLLAAKPGRERPPVLVPDGAGGVIVLFECVPEDGQRGIFAQRVSRDGKRLWREGKQPIPVATSVQAERRVSAVSDGAGGAIAVFEVEHTSGRYAGDVDIRAQRITADGDRAWGEGKGAVVVSAQKGREGHPVAVSDGQGGALVAFDYVRAAGEHAGDSDVLAQRLDPNGTRLWSNTPRSVASSPSLERAPAAVATDEGGMVVVLEYEHQTGTRAGTSEVVAQRLDGDGKRVWNEGKRSSMVFSLAQSEHSPRVVRDDRGGIVVVALVDAAPEWGLPGGVVLVAQRLDAGGTRTWGEGRKPVPVGAGLGPDLHPCVVATRAP